MCALYIEGKTVQGRGEGDSYDASDTRPFTSLLTGGFYNTFLKKSSSFLLLLLFSIILSS